MSSVLYNTYIKVAFCQKVWWGSKKYSKSLSWAENFPPIMVNNILKFSTEDSDLEYFFEPHKFFWDKATFRKSYDFHNLNRHMQIANAYVTWSELRILSQIVLLNKGFGLM